MKHSFARTFAALTTAAALVFVAPAMAQAYTPTGPDTVTVTITASGTVPFTGFEPGASVTFTLTGEEADDATLAMAKFVVNSKKATKTADSTGNASVQVVLPSDASGSYQLSATGARATAAAGGTDASAADTLPSTGFDGDSLLGLWVGGGALVLAGATIAVATTVRRGRAESRS